VRRLAIAALALAAWANEAAADRGAVPAGARQLVLATVESWDDTTAELARFEREPGRAWKQVGPAWPAVIGRAGSAWGRGLHGRGAPRGRSGPRKREGDGKSPAGAFALGASFGYAPRPPSGARAKYAAVDDSWVCVDDPRSARYNRVFDADGVRADWSSFEQMRRPDELYRWVVVVEHNQDAAAGGGSCIFLHLWGGPGSATSGCTAMDRRAMESLLSWIDPAARPVFVLLPARERAALGRAWGLPP
jgi:L,D-peptidoglycan transpeptidase YkuD (ErfK/YbiS/YcfS/YnhG family)